jgi:rfaE bifunctional protein nucleotidyltransferase chain/domain
MHERHGRDVGNQVWCAKRSPLRSIYGKCVSDAVSWAIIGPNCTATVTLGEIKAHFGPHAGEADPQKLFSLENILPMVYGWCLQRQKIALTNGCFELHRPGHISLLDQASRCADRLIVELNADSSIWRLKGPGRPVQSEVARATGLGALKSVDAVMLFCEDTPINLIESSNPMSSLRAPITRWLRWSALTSCWAEEGESCSHSSCVATVRPRP